MFQTIYDEMLRFSAQDSWQNELKAAKQEYVERTGGLFESDDSFEQRMASFLEWYTLDRPLKSLEPARTPAQWFSHFNGTQLSSLEHRLLEALISSQLSLIEFRKDKTDHILVLDLLVDKKISVFGYQSIAGISSGDILEARLIPFEDKIYVSDTMITRPKAASKLIYKAVKQFIKAKNSDPLKQTSFVHKVAFYSNKSERYKHIKPLEIFADLLKMSA